MEKIEGPFNAEISMESANQVFPEVHIWTQSDPYWVAVKVRNREKFQSDLIELLRSKDTLKQNIHSWISNPESRTFHTVAGADYTFPKTNPSPSWRSNPQSLKSLHEHN